MVAGPIAAWAQPPPIVPIEQETVVTGTPTALEGRWLLLTTLGTAGRGRAEAALWEVMRIDGQLRLTQRSVDLPGGKLASGVDPTPAELQTIARDWGTLASEPRGVDRIAHEVFGADAADVAREASTAGALWVVRQNLGITPGPTRPLKEVRVLAARTADAAGYRGSCLTVVLAAAPMPIPIKVEGTFRLLRLPRPAPSPWARVLDVFRGCN
jgi:hypothetical protein